MKILLTKNYGISVQLLEVSCRVGDRFIFTSLKPLDLRCREAKHSTQYVP